MANQERTESKGQQSTPSTTRSQGQTGLTRREPLGILGGSPFGSLFRRWNEEMDRMFEDFGFGSMTRGPRARPSIWWSAPISLVSRRTTSRSTSPTMF
jgi:hypothetical protein